MNPAPALVLVVDDDLAVLRSLDRLLTAHGHAVQTYSDPKALFRAGSPPPPVCLVLDQHLGPVKGTDVHAGLNERGWNLPTIFLTADFDTRTVVAAMRSGADDYLTKPYDPDELVAAVRRALQHSVAAQQAGREQAEYLRLAATLSPRQRQVVSMVLGGLLNKEISDRLKIALVTIKVHRGQAMRKLGAKNTAELARIAALAGITPAG